jgi:predicted aspartyl protease
MVLMLIASNCISAQSTQAWDVATALGQNHELIQMSKLSTGHDVVEATINGQTGLFIVDTGAITVINQSLMNKYKLSSEDKIKSQNAAGAGGAIVIDTYSMDSMTLGELHVPLEHVGVTDLNAVSQGLFNATGQLIDGIIGQDILLAMHAIIDGSNQHLYFEK